MIARRGMGGHQSASALSSEWATPPHVLTALGGAQSFYLDPCAMVNAPWNCAQYAYTIKDNGLSKQWQGLVYCNPPYGAATGEWLARCADHGNAVALVFARTETEAFQHVWQGATAILFLQGRLFFHRPDGRRADHNSGAPSVLVAYGVDGAKRLALCGLPGFYFELKHGRAVP